METIGICFISISGFIERLVFKVSGFRGFGLQDSSGFTVESDGTHHLDKSK